MRRDFGWLPLLAAGLAACGRCGGHPAATPGASIEELLPASAPAVAIVPSISHVMRDAKGLAKAVARFPEGETVGGILDALTAQLGFDPGDDKALARAGIDGQRPAALVFEGGEPWLVVPVVDRGRFEAMARKLIASRLGADKTEQRGEVTVFSSTAGPAAALAFTAAYGLIGSGPAAADELGRALGRKKEERLANDRLFARARGTFGADWDVEAYLPAGSPYLPSRPLPGRAFVAGVFYRDGRLAARVMSLLSVAEGTGMSTFAMAAGQPLVGLLPPADPLFARLGGNPAGLTGLWQNLVPPDVRNALATAKIDADKEVLGNVEPGIVASVGLAKHLDLSAAPSLDPRVQNPFRYLTLDVFAKVRDPKAALATLKKLGELPPGLGVSTGHTKIGETDVETFHYALGDGPSVALVGNTLAVTGGEGEMEGALARLAGKAPGYIPPPWMRRALLGQVSDGAVFDTSALRLAIEAIPASAYGGLTGLTIRSLVRRFANPLIWVGPITATVDVGPDALVIDADLSFR
jgi:hypothetical protein